MKILQYIYLHMKNSILQIAHCNTCHPLRYAHVRYAKYLFTNIQKQQNMLKSSKVQTLRVNNSKILRIQNAKFSGYCFYMNTKKWRDFQICTSVHLRRAVKILVQEVMCSLIMKNLRSSKCSLTELNIFYKNEKC